MNASPIKQTINTTETTPEVNLIDLSDDVHKTENKEQQISDYQIKMLEEFLKTSKLKCKQIVQQDAELQCFFDKYEYNQPKALVFGENSQLVPTPRELSSEDLSIFENKTEIRQENNFIHNIDVTPKVLVPRLELESDDEEDINEDLIDEVMYEQQMEKQLISAAKKNIYKELGPDILKNQVSESLNTLMDTKVLKPPSDLAPPIATTSYGHNNQTDSKKSYDNSHILNEIITKNKINHKITAGVNIPEFTAKLLKVPNTNKSETVKDAFDTKTNLEQKALNEKLVTEYGMKYLEAVKKVDKTFQKKNDLKSDAEKSKLTPGPSLYEKTVVLPQIMHRLNEKNKTKDKRTMQMRLVLDAGQSHGAQSNKQSSETHSGISESSPVLPPPEILMKDCNKERLIAYETWKLFKEFVNAGNHFAK